MLQEEFARKMAEAQAHIEKAKKDMREWRKQYIEENAPYKVGDKVKIVTPADPRWREKEETVFGFIKSIDVSEMARSLQSLMLSRRMAPSIRISVYGLAGIVNLP